MFRVLMICVLSMLLAGCAARELPENDATGSDKMKKSPCVCLQIHYAPEFYTWRG